MIYHQTPFKKTHNFTLYNHPRTLSTTHSYLIYAQVVLLNILTEHDEEERKRLTLSLKPD